MKIVVKLSLAAALLATTLFASTPSSVGQGLSAAPNHTHRTCKGTGAKRECLACVTTDGARTCWWYAAPSK